MTRTAAEFGAHLASIPGDVDVEWLLELLRRSAIADKDEDAFLEAYFGSPRRLHFVGFKSKCDPSYVSAVRVFGRPDFFHRKNDLRFVFGGELAPHDIVVYANGEENVVRLYSVDDSNVDVQAFEKEQRRA